MCVLATASAAGPLATPVRYFHLDFTLLFTTAADSPKMRNIGLDPRVSIGVFAPLVGQASSRGAQIFGRARTLMPSDQEFAKYWPAVRWQSDHVERSRSLESPPDGPLWWWCRRSASCTRSTGCAARATRLDRRGGSSRYSATSRGRCWAIHRSTSSLRQTFPIASSS